MNHNVLSVCLVLSLMTSANGQSNADQDAINALIDKYGQTEDAGTLLKQAEMMSADRVWIGANGAGRITNQAMNMKMQQTQVDAATKMIQGVEWFTDARDRLIKLYGDGSFAVASFYWHRTFVLPPRLNAEQRKAMGKQPDPVAISHVLEKKGGDWRIVHTHVSSLVKKEDN